MRRARLVPVALLFLALVLTGSGASATGDFRDDFALPPGFNLTVDTSGYSIPTAIAFVPHPGPRPKSPLYYVAELRGTIKVVTRDRSVHQFADLGLRRPRVPFPALGGQNGAAGMCLDEKHGYVFVSYAAFDRKGVLRNGLVRLSAKPGTFSLRASGSKEIGQIFAPYPTAANHQIGGCVVVGDSLYVGVGDGAASSRAQDLDQLSGKIVRMTLDGAPAPGNPFLTMGGPARYVWSYGLRNPFGLTSVDGNVFATQNGNSIDNFLAVTRGRNYGWDGTDASIATNAEAVFIPAVAPVHVAYIGDSSFFPETYRRSFFFASAEGTPERGAGVWSFGYDVGKEVVDRAPANFVRATRSVSGLALGPDGLYFAPLEPDHAPTAAVYRVTYDPAAKYPNQQAQVQSGDVVFEQLGCRSCHSLNNVGGDVGPALDNPGLNNRLQARLSSDEYRRRVELMDAAGGPAGAKAARHAVLDENGLDQVALWIKERVLDPKFDDPNAAMPKVGASPAEAAAVSDYLVHGVTNLEGAGKGGTAQRSFTSRASDAVHSKRFAGGAVLGFVVGCVLAGAAVLLAGRRRTRPS